MNFMAVSAPPSPENTILSSHVLPGHSKKLQLRGNMLSFLPCLSCYEESMRSLEIRLTPCYDSVQDRVENSPRHNR
jgi:hypothetical protein